MTRLKILSVVAKLLRLQFKINGFPYGSVKPVDPFKKFSAAGVGRNDGDGK